MEIVYADEEKWGMAPNDLSLPAALKALRLRSGLSMADVARGLGFAGASSYQRYEDPGLYRKGHLPVDLVSKLITVLEGHGDPPITRAEIAALAGFQGMSSGEFEGGELVTRSVAQPTPSELLIPHDQLVGESGFPIFASAQGGPDGMETSFEIIERVKWPAPLIGVPRGFGMYVVGDSMEPAYNHGDMLLCHPSLPPKKNDAVLVVKQSPTSEHSCLVKFYVSEDYNKFRLAQLNPPDDRIIVPRAAVRGVHVVVGKYNRR